MNTETNGLAEREEIEMLLPWYVTGKLDGDDRKHVETYLASHPELQGQLDLIRDEQTRTSALYDRITGPSDDFDDRLVSEIDRQTRRPWHVFQGLFSWLSDLFGSPASGAIRWAGAAAAVIIVVQAVAITSLVQTGDDQGYIPANGPEGTYISGTYVLVKFTNDATAPQISRALADLRMTIAGGPRGGFFVVRVGPDTMSTADRDRQIAELKKQSGIVAFVTLSK